jgi:DNA polymerase III delta prime subunit
MIDYSFLTLSPNEFENMSRDLIQRKLSVFIESFTTGRDGGVDFRFATDKLNTVIIQSKRYKDYTSLYKNLKKEVDKVERVNPDRYILTTSVGLTPKRKLEIQKLFEPYIKSAEDILGKDDLNNLLGTYTEIENKYYKLWLTSVNILEKILHGKIYNQSSFELEEIKEQVKLYVQNDSFNEALSILKKHHYIIISGIPGIGKTTLSRILILYLLSSKFEEFVYLTDTIDEAYKYFKEGRKQIFFFDDFLGKIRFDAKNLVNADNKIVKFIEKIKKSPDKALIFATREYILRQARTTFEVFNTSNIEIAKCILDLSSYTRIIKAQILYNHLFFANVPQCYLEDLVLNGNYLELVNHKNYNPRIIETIINRKIWEYCIPTEFSKALRSYFDNPQSVWQYAFENSLDRFSQYVLLVLLTLGSPVFIQDLEKCMKEFLVENSYKYFIGFDPITFDKAIRELESTFIKTLKDSEDTIVIEFQNPSIQDFLINYLRDKNDLITSLIDASLFSDQFFNIFTCREIENVELSRFIKINLEQAHSSIDRIKKVYPQIKESKVLRIRKSNSEEFKWHRYSNFHYSFLKDVNSQLAESNTDAKDFVYEKFQERILMNSYSYKEQSAYMSLLKELDLKKLTYNEEQLIDAFLENIHWLDNFDPFCEFGTIFPVTYERIINSRSFKGKINKVVDYEIENVDDSDIRELISKIESVESKYSIDYVEKIVGLREKEDDYNSQLGSQTENYIDANRDSDERKGLSDSEEIEVINQLFNSLLN